MSKIPLTPTQAADIAGCHPETIRRAIEAGKLKGGRIGRYYGVTVSALCDWLQDGRHRKDGATAENGDVPADKCGLCRKRPRAVYLARRVNRWVCWPCMQLAAHAAMIGQPVYSYVRSRVTR